MEELEYLTLVCFFYPGILLLFFSHKDASQSLIRSLCKEDQSRDIPLLVYLGVCFLSY